MMYASGWWSRYLRDFLKQIFDHVFMCFVPKRIDDEMFWSSLARFIPFFLFDAQTVYNFGLELSLDSTEMTFQSKRYNLWGA